MKPCTTCGKTLGKRSYWIDKAADKRQCSCCYQMLHRPSKEQKVNYQRSWRKTHPEQVARIRQREYHTFRGYTYSLYRGISKKAKLWKVPCDPWRVFWKWAKKNAEYRRLFSEWIFDGQARFFNSLVDFEIRRYAEKEVENIPSLDHPDGIPAQADSSSQGASI